ncbi:MAG: hypothetical protein IK095_08550 [Oscillospiraceae bacterium]|nr:hypothetical protein [Oscillospiraceae bacterium]
MDRLKVFQALSELDDAYIAEAMHYAPERAARSPGRNKNMKKRILTLALAAALLLALSVTAYAAFSSMSHRIPEPEETFCIHWDDSPDGYLEWHDAKLVVTFPDTAESKQIEFRTGWLPEEMAPIQSDAWHDRLTAERLCDNGGPRDTAVQAYSGMVQPLLIESYSMSMFNDGGALLLLYYTPEDIIEEHWDGLGVDVMRFHCTQHLDAVPEYNVPERTLEQDILLLSNAEEGWVVRVCGEIGMDQLIKVAKSLEIRETGKILTYEDFPSHYTFMDGGVG